MAKPSDKPVVLLTGASRGLGLCIAQLLLKGGTTWSAAHVVTLSRSQTDDLLALQKESEAASTQLVAVQGSVTSKDDNENAVKVAMEKFGRLDAVIFNAGVIEFARLADVTPESFANQIQVNVSSLVTTLHYALPHLRNSPTGCGKAVFVSSGAATSGRASWGAYNAGKAAMNGIARTLASEEDKVASFAIAPGVVATEMQRDIREKAKGKMSDEDHQKFIDLHTSGQLLPPEQPGHVLAALAVTGTRSEPANLGREGAFVRWDCDELKALRLPQ